MKWELYVSVVALFVSVISSVYTYRLSARTADTSVRPVLVFEYGQNNGWVIRNVGNGPALNVLIAEKTEKSSWEKPVRIPPLQKDGYVQLNWIGHRNVRTFGSDYVDIDNRQYSSTCTNDLSATNEGHVLGVWKDEEIVRYWQFSQVKP